MSRLAEFPAGSPSVPPCETRDKTRGSVLQASDLLVLVIFTCPERSRHLSHLDGAEAVKSDHLRGARSDSSSPCLKLRPSPKPAHQGRSVQWLTVYHPPGTARCRHDAKVASWYLGVFGRRAIGHGTSADQLMTTRGQGVSARTRLFLHVLVSARTNSLLKPA
ncbi:hypothetical protein RRG08_018121 [Elysia crispata]|uniref:Uncharacterized protein n=1 Tax=Elysia crispata TaxID=231223 RepID=A0AAE0ZVK4_9GAST|nr:hypothetical protein RRG08_018121 [Elysia crispata]